VVKVTISLACIKDIIKVAGTVDPFQPGLVDTAKKFNGFPFTVFLAFGSL